MSTGCVAAVWHFNFEDHYISRIYFQLSLRIAHCRFVRLNNADDHAEKTNSASEDLNDQNFDEKGRILRVSEGGAASNNTDCKTADEVAETDSQSATEDHVTSGKISSQNIVARTSSVEWLELSDEDKGHNDAEDGDGLTENDGHQVLRTDTGCLHTTTQNGRTSRENTPSSANDGQREGKADTQTAPHMRRCFLKEPGDVESMTLARQHIE